MPGTIYVSRSDVETIIKIKGRFVFDPHRQFRSAYYVEKDKKNKQFVIDMSEVEYLDSSAIWMLLVMRDETGAPDGSISIINAKNSVARLLHTVNLQRLFIIK